jgi:hypothetical protein
MNVRNTMMLVVQKVQPDDDPIEHRNHWHINASPFIALGL